MDRQTQIQEMAEVVQKVQYLGGLELSVAARIYDAGYRKIDKTTEDLLREIESLKHEVEAQRFANKRLLKKHKQDRERLWKRCRIKTAKEFVEKLKKDVDTIDLGCGAGSYDYVSIEDINDLVEEFEKEAVKSE